MPMFKFKCTVEIDGCDEERTFELPGKMVVCWRCNGEGVHTRPGIDDNGLTRSDFDEDPDFEEDYYAGRYDTQCTVCHGENVICDVDFDAVLERSGSAYAGTLEDTPRSEWAEAWKAYKNHLEDQRFEAQERRNDAHVRRQESGGY